MHGECAAYLIAAMLLACCAEPPGWRSGTPLPGPRFEAPALTLGGRIYYVGGITGTDGDITSAEPASRVDIFDPTTRTWSRGPDLPADAPKHHLAAVVMNDRIFVLGGFDGIIGRGIATDAFRPIATTWVLEGAAWRRLADQPLARGGATAQAIGGVIYVAGGAATEGVPSYADLYAYDPSSDTWSVRAPMPTAREHVASCMIDGRMIVVGGWAGAARIAQHAAEQYDPSLDSWTVLQPMPTSRGGLGAATVAGRCYVVGGEDWALPLPGTFATLEVYDPGAQAWHPGPAMTVSRHGIGATSRDGALWVIGGGPAQGNSYTDRVEIFQP